MTRAPARSLRFEIGMTDMKERAENYLERGARWFVRRAVGGEDAIRELVDDADAPAGEALIDEVARRATRRAAARAFVTGLVDSPWTAIPLAMVDAHGATSAEAKIAATIAWVRDPDLFQSDDWDRAVLRAMLDMPPTADLASTGLTGALGKRALLHQTKRYAARLATGYVPLVGSVLGAGVEVAFLKWRTARLKELLGDAPSSASVEAIREREVPPPPPTLDPPPRERLDREPAPPSSLT